MNKIKSYQGKYKPGEVIPYKISRSKIENFLRCPRCFYLDRRLKVAQPNGPPFLLNSAVDKLLKAEFDIHRLKGVKHPLQREFGIDAIPIPHEDLNLWRENFHGIQYLHPASNFLVTGAIDDLWQNPAGEYIVVDYKATAKGNPVTELEDTKWHDAYRRQMEIYQWLLRQLGYKVSNTGYFVYCTGKRDEESFNKKLEFDINVIPYTGNDNWVEKAIIDAHSCLNSDLIPKSSEDCEYCKYFNERTGVEN